MYTKLRIREIKAESMWGSHRRNTGCPSGLHGERKDVLHLAWRRNIDIARLFFSSHPYKVLDKDSCKCNGDGNERTDSPNNDGKKVLGALCHSPPTPNKSIQVLLVTFQRLALIWVGLCFAVSSCQLYMVSDSKNTGIFVLSMPMLVPTSLRYNVAAYQHELLAI